MSTQKNKKLTKYYIMRGFRNALLCDVIAIAALTVIAVIVALFKHSYIMKSIYMAYYFGGGFIMMVAIPQFYKRSSRVKTKGVNTNTPMFGFYDWFGGNFEEEIDESYEKFKGDGFWLGIMLVTAGAVIVALGVILENIFFV